MWFCPHTHTSKVPVSVNYHFTRQVSIFVYLELVVLDTTETHECNYECGFCFHTAKTSYIAPIVDAKRGLKLLAKAGMRKINFAGGEPFLYVSFMGKLLKLVSPYEGATKIELMQDDTLDIVKKSYILSPYPSSPMAALSNLNF